MRAPNNRWKWIVSAVAGALMAATAIANNKALDNNTAPPAGITALVAENSGGGLAVDLTGLQIVSENSLKLVLDSGQLAILTGGATGVCPATAITTKNYAAKKPAGIALADNQIAAFDQAAYHLIANGPAPNDTAITAFAIDKVNGNANMDYGANAPNIAGNVANANNTDSAVPDILASGLIGQKVEVITANHAAELANYDNVANGLNVNHGGAFASAFNGDLPNSASTVTSSAFADTLATNAPAPPMPWV